MNNFSDEKGVNKTEENDIVLHNEKQTNEKQRKKLGAKIEWLETFACCFAVVVLFITFVARHSPVVGNSMRNTLHWGDVVLVSEIGYTPKNGDIIVAQSEILGYDEPIVKRVIATGGQKVDIDYEKWTVSVDGETLSEPYILKIETQAMLKGTNVGDSFIVPEGYIFVMGDNRNGSMDSRDARVGFIDSRMVLGQVVYRLYPFETMGKLS